MQGMTEHSGVSLAATAPAPECVNTLICSSGLGQSDILGVLALQQLAVGGDLLLQATLDVHEHFVLLVLALHVAAELAQLLLHAADDDLDLSQLRAVSGFRVPQVGLQPSFLKSNNVRTG